MPETFGGIIVEPNGKTLVVTFTNTGGKTPTVYTTANGSTTHTLPLTITETTAFHFRAKGGFFLSAKLNDDEIAGRNGSTLPFSVENGSMIAVSPDVDPVEQLSQSGSYGTVRPEDFDAEVATLGATGSVTSGQAVFTDPSASFPASCVGDTILVAVTGYSSVLVTTILSRDSATQVTLAANAPSTVTNKPYLYGPDCTAEFTAMAAALAAGDRVELAGIYIISGEGPNIDVPVKIAGRGVHTSNDSMTGTGIASTSATAHGLVENAKGIVLEDFGIWNLATTAPTEGAGIYVETGDQGRKRGIVVSGFYDCIDYTATSGRYWTITDGCQILDPVRYGIRIRNTTPSGDEGDMTISGGCSFCTWSARQPDAAVRWESGGGLKFVGNKINQGDSGPSWDYGLDFMVADGVTTGVFPISANSIENCTAAAIRVDTLGGSHTGYLSKMVITGNEIAPFGSASDGIVISPGAVWNFTDFLIADNVIRDYGVSHWAVKVDNLDSFTIRGNRFRGTYHIYIGNACTGYDIDQRGANGNGVPIYNQASDNYALVGRPIGDTRGIQSLAASASTNLWDVEMAGMNSGCMVEVVVAGRMISGAGAGPVARRKRFWITAVSGTPTVSAMLDDENFSASTINITTTVSGTKVTLAVTHADTGSTFRGNVNVTVTGPLSQFACR